eukprot:UN03781
MRLLFEVILITTSLHIKYIKVTFPNNNLFSPFLPSTSPSSNNDK